MPIYSKSYEIVHKNVSDITFLAYIGFLVKFIAKNMV